MLDFKPNFYKKIFQSVETSSVLMKVEQGGEKYFPVWCSKEFSEMIEGTEEEFIKRESKSALENIHPDDREEVEYLFKNRKTKSGTKNLNIRRQTLKGNWLWVNVHFAFVKEGGDWYAYLTYFDVTKIVEGERRAKHLYESVSAELENIASESLVALRLNLTKDIVEDCRGKEIYDVDIKGEKISDNFWERLHYLPLERDRKIFSEKFTSEKLLQSYKDGNRNISDVFFSQRPSGRKCFVKYNVTLSKDPETGDIIAFASEHDYNDEKVNEVILHKALVEQYDMITYIIDGHYGVVIGDADSIKNGNIFPREREGSYEQYIEEQVRPVLTGTYADKRKNLAALSLERIERSLAIRDPYEVNIICHIDGELCYKRFVFYLVDSEAKFYILLKSDTTQLQKIQLMRNAQLKAALDNANQANVAKTAFLSNMSHEIRTPMNAIIGLDTIALSEPGISERTRDHLEKIGASARHLLTLINDVLDMSRIESGKMNLKNEEFSFGKMLEQINTIIDSQCAEKKLNYACQLLNKIDEYYVGDVVKLKQILLNILGNAVKFTPSPGHITLTVEKVTTFDKRSTLKFVVRDTGIGMEADFIPKIFDVFSQEDSNTTNAYGGTGLGMPITKSIVEMMNGKISVKSEKDFGSEFTVTITLRDSDKNESVRHLGITPQDLNVLVIDDDPISCEHAKVVLEEVGTSAEIANSGAQALEMIKLRLTRHEPYNLIFVDWKMPDQDGVEITRNIRKIIGEDSAIIFLTAYNWEEVEEEATKAGVDRFMAKPLFASQVMEEFIKVMKQKNIILEPERKKVDLSGKRILLAEDMLVNAEIIKELLKMREMEVDHAENGEMVVKMFEKSLPNLKAQYRYLFD